MATIEAVKVRTGDFVRYFDTRGLEKTALCLATPHTLAEGHSVPELEQGEIHCLVFSPSGRHYARQNVRQAEGEPLSDERCWMARA